MILASLLELFPEAPVSALDEAAIMIPMPASVPLVRNTVLEARAGVDLLVFDQQVVSAWDRVLVEGSARWSFSPVGYPDISGTLYMLDLREIHGAIVTFAVYDENAVRDGVAVLPEPVEVIPRFARMLKDPRGIIVEIDDAVTKILGWSAEEMQGRRSIEFIHPDDNPLAIDNWMQMLAVPGPGRRVRLRHRRKDDSWVWFEVTNHNHLQDPDKAIVVSEMVDISEEMAAHEELRAREQLLDRLAEAAPVGLLQFDVSRNVVYTNDRLHEILDTERAATVEAQLATVVERDWPLLDRAVEEVLAQGLQVDMEVELQSPGSAQRRSCAVGLRALSDDAGAVSGAIACLARRHPLRRGARRPRPPRQGTKQ
jgi:PAS domain S-box-containing protein